MSDENRKVMVQVSALFMKGFALHQEEKIAQAQELYQQVLVLQPRNFDAQHLLGVIAHQTGNPSRAAELIGKAIEINPRDAVAHNNHAAALENLKQYEAAVKSYDQAIALKADYAEAYTNRGNALRALKRYELAIESHDSAIRYRPDFAGAYYNRGIVLGDLGRLEAAIESYDKAIALKADYAEAYNNRGTALRNLAQPHAALDSYDKAIAFRANYAEAYSNRGNALKDLNRHRAALESYEKAIALKPNDAGAHLSHSLCLLLTGDFQSGWRKYEWRWGEKDLKETRRSFAQPLWLGKEPLKGKTILLHSEQGLGDTIQFCRYAKLVNDLGARVVLEVQPPLVSLLTSLEGVAELVARGSALPAFDYHCPLLSLPLAFRTNLDNIPATSSYLDASPTKVTQWTTRLGEKTKPRVGLVWSGSTGHKNDRNRSIPLGELLNHLPNDFQYISIQKELRDADKGTLEKRPDVLHFGEELKDFTDTAALCGLVDVVLSVDTSVAHLAGALGKSVWILLPFNPDWRWLLDRNDSPWYPSVRLFRQSQYDDWGSVISTIGETLNVFLQTRKN
jgi:tetratricopeptide (TPR) repeat protein